MSTAVSKSNFVAADGWGQTLNLPLKQHGLRATEGRKWVLGLLMEQGKALSHAEVMACLALPLAAAALTLDRATVYRNLMDLTQAGLLERKDYGDHVWRFKVAAGVLTGHLPQLHQHPHFVCTTCQEEICLPELELAPPPTLEGTVNNVVLQGICKDCN